MIYALETAKGDMLNELHQLMKQEDKDKVEKVLAIYKACGIDLWANALKEQYLEKAFLHLEEIAVSKERKASLVELAHYLIKRDK